MFLRWRGKNSRSVTATQLNLASRPPARSARMSLQHVPYAQHHARLSLVAEAPSPQQSHWVDKRASYIQPEQVEQWSSHSLQGVQLPQIVNSLPQRRSSETELLAPIRKRSLLQHGVATRKSSVGNDEQQSLPSQMSSMASQGDLHNNYYTTLKSTSSPLPSNAALAPKFKDNPPGPRTNTPIDLDYGSIGAFKLGSLRITNGAASPTPSLDMSAMRSNRDDYLVAGQGSAKSHRELLPKSNTFPMPQEIIKANYLARSDSPLRQALEPEGEQTIRVNTHLPLPEFSAFNFNLESPTRALDLAHGYRQELALSPFSLNHSPPRTPRLEPTSKHTAIEDDLFEAEPVTPEVEEMHPFQSIDPGYQAEDSQLKTAVEGERDLALKPLAKADSGYSSNVSLRSFKGSSKSAVLAEEPAPSTHKDSISRVASGAYSVKSSCAELCEIKINSEGSRPPLPVGDMVPPLREAPPIPLKHSPVQSFAKTILTPPLPNQYRQQEWPAALGGSRVVMAPNLTQRQGLPVVQEPLRDRFTPGHSPSASTGSESSGSISKWRKEKKRPQSLPPQPIYTVQAFRTVSEELSVPPVPADKSRHLKERVDTFPVACFPNTVSRTNQLKHTVSKETLGTIFSVGSAEYREELTSARLQSALPPAPAEPTIPEIPSPKPEVNRRHTFQPLSPAPPVSALPSRNRQSLQANLQKVPPIQQESQEAFENHITSHESISSSLGKSPYDFALGPPTRQTPQERAKSMTFLLEAEARSRFALARSASQEPLPSAQTNAHQKSLESQSVASSALSVSQTPKSRPPQAHARWSGLGTSSSSPSPRPALLSLERSNPSFAGDDGPQFSMLGQDRVNLRPPVSMQTRRKPVAPARTPPPPPAPVSESAHLPTTKDSANPQSQEPEARATRKSLRAERRKSDSEALQGRKSVGKRPQQTPRASMDQQQRSQMRSHVSRDANQQRWDVSSEQPYPQYDHTYGSISSDQEKEKWTSHSQASAHQTLYHQEPEYYEGPSYEEDDLQRAQQLPHTIQTIHQRQTSTSSMLVLDRFAGGLDYGYEPGAGFGGSAGTRNTGKLAQGGRKGVDLSMRYGVDFSDIPIFLTRVEGEA